MEIDIQNLHHAYLIESDTSRGCAFIDNLLERMDFSKLNNPDLHIFENSPFTVDDARILRERAQGKSFGSKKIFIISSQTFTLQAQNALLKSLEEPSSNTHFFILLPERDLLLPTLLSRLEIIHLHGEGIKNAEAENFLKLSPKDRLDFVKKFVDKEKPLASFLDSIFRLLKEKGISSEIEKVFTLRKYADDPSVMQRLILEHLALVLK